MNFIEELSWRGMIHTTISGVEEQLKKEMTTAYVGIDPTADSLHIGHLVSVMMLKHFQVAGHKPIILVGGATGMIGDPSGKSAERNLLDEASLRHNQECLKNQLSKFLDFGDSTPNGAEMVNNYDWMKNFSFLDFIRDIGKHITVNYMMSKESVKKRLDGESREGMSFTEFTYQLVQGYDFLHLFREKNCKIQMGGSDQWGNITTGTELIGRVCGGDAFAITCNLITKADGSKFGKTESGNIWLDPEKTSPYKIYQFWLNTSDEDAIRFIKIFTLLPKDEIEGLIEQQQKEPHARHLQKKLAVEVTIMVHGENALNMAIEASQILFGKGTTDTLKSMDENTLLSVFEGVPTYEFSLEDLIVGVKVADLLVDKTSVFGSKGDARKMIQAGGVSINKSKLINHEVVIDDSMLLNDKYLLVQKGKRDYSLLIAK